MMRARLFCKTGPMANVDVSFEDVLTIGRTGSRRAAPGELALDSEQISAQHARITWDGTGGTYVLEDLGSTNGTELDRMPVHGKVRLDNQCVITFAGEFDFIFTVGSAAVASRATPSPQPEVVSPGAASRPTVLDPSPRSFVPPQPPSAGETVRQAPPPAFVPPRPVVSGETVRQAPPPAFVPPRPVVSGETVRQAPPPAFVPPRIPSAPPEPAPAPAAPRVQLEVRVQGAAPRVYELKPGANRIGRLADNDIVIQHPTVSKQHAVVIVDSNGILLQSISQNSRTFVGGAPIQQIRLQRGTQVHFGEVETFVS